MEITQHEAMEIVGLSEDYTEAELRDQIRKLAVTWLPQRNNIPEESHRRFGFLSNVYKKLTREAASGGNVHDMPSKLAGELFCKDGLLLDQWKSAGRSTTGLQGGDQMRADNDVSTEVIDRIYAQKMKASEELSSGNVACPLNHQASSAAEHEAARHADELVEAERKEKEKAERRKLKKKAKKKKKQLDEKSTCGMEESSDGRPIASAQQLEDAAPPTPEADECVQTRVEADTGELDMNSAFIARATTKKCSVAPTAINNSKLSASIAKPVIGTNDTGQPLAQDTISDPYDELVMASRQLADAGNKAAKSANYHSAIQKYSEAIGIYPFDHRYFGNRSYCYEYIKNYASALGDANSAIKLNPDWPKGYFRKAKALVGLGKYQEAEMAFLKSIQLDPSYKDAHECLQELQIGELKKMGFDIYVAESAVRKHKTIQASVDAILSGKVETITLSEADYKPDVPVKGTSLSTEPQAIHPPEMESSTQLRSLWVGNINSTDVTEELLQDIFGRYGEITSIRVIYERRCAFVNFSEEQYAASALKALQGYCISGTNLLLRYPARSVSVNTHPSKSGPVNGNECYFWRHTGVCSFGSHCKYLHLPDKKGIGVNKIGHVMDTRLDKQGHDRFS